MNWDDSLQVHGVELLLMKTQDLVSNPDPEVRRRILSFYGAVVRGQFDSLDVMRAQFFRLIETHAELKADFACVFNILFALTKEGKMIDRFADKVCPSVAFSPTFLILAFQPHGRSGSKTHIYM